MKQAFGFIFPGQGSQKVGMLSELSELYPNVQKTFAEASTVLGYDLWELIQQDPDEKLSQTSVTQPAILASSVAIWRLWLELGGVKPALMAGHSLGEYSALVCGGALTFEDAIALVQKRGEFMQSAVPVGVGAMAAIVGLEDQLVIDACVKAGEDKEDEVVVAVNFNSPGQVVIAGHTEAVQRAGAYCKDAGAKRCLPLPVSAPFHSPLMKPAADRFASELKSVSLIEPETPVLQNYGLKLTSSDSELIRDNLLKQIYSPVPWVDSIKMFAKEGIVAVYELGPGKVLSGLNRRIDSAMTAMSINDDSSLQAALAHSIAKEVSEEEEKL